MATEETAICDGCNGYGTDGRDDYGDEITCAKCEGAGEVAS